ncbi:class II aldolase/adducin family protein [Actinomyces sp. B33]|uniref:class II aldolase/adducin family protein n=1 Tax=Actinomyces sp. B33 TaxID=2942131 RepID=UPI00234246E3|nr:class II aldolase/adducin family protein [Actinomyces sp. B33]MDC4233426.1 class II aldolase/adducin family protein [Actinomyces sp. B33]
MSDLTSQLIALANDIGGDTEFSRAGGGNASVKTDGVLHIKPSGVPLATLAAEDLVPLRIDVLLDALHSDEEVDGDPVRAAARRAQIGDAGGRRPSVEILFHALIPDPLVLHLHPLTANALTCNEDGPALAREILGDEAVWVDYIDPGVPLARGVEAARDAHAERTGRPAPGIVLLGNHGIIVSGATYDEVAERTRFLTDRIRAAIDAAPAPAPEAADDLPADRRDALVEAFRTALGSEATASSCEGHARTSSSAQAGPVSRGPLIPDQIVYSGSFPLVLAGDEDEAGVTAAVAAFREAHGRAPIVAVVPGRLVIAAGDSPAAAQNALATYLDALRVAADADRIGRVRVMDERERHFIENWEAEAYRRSVAKEG